MAKGIPRTIRLPFGYTVHVRQVSKTKMRAAAGCDVSDVTPEGCWCVDDMTIYVLSSLPMARRRYVVCHEIQHAALDLTHQQLEDGVGKSA